MQVVILAHGIAAIANEQFNANLDLGKVALIATYHDVSEVITGDMATPVKYSNEIIRDAFHDMEAQATDTLIEMLPDDLKPSFEPYLKPDETSREWRIVKAADKLSAYIKCVEELKAGNSEFASARTTIYDQLMAIDLPELHAFMRIFVTSFGLTLDEITTSQ